MRSSASRLKGNRVAGTPPWERFAAHRGASRRAIGLVGALAALLGLAPSAHAGLVLTEVYYDSALADLTEPDEWMEVANTGATDLDLSAFRIGDANDANASEGAIFTFPSVYLAPGEVALVAKSGTSFAANWIAPAGVKVFAMRDTDTDQYPMTHQTGWAGGPSAMALANGGDEVILVTQTDGNWSVVDGSAWGTGKTKVAFPGSGEQAFIAAPIAGGAGFGGQSIARISARVDTDSASDWQRLATPTVGTAPFNICGNATVEAGESCDDGGTAAGDGCAALCTNECGYSCAGAPSACATDCGDGMVAGDETCDDGNAIPGDGCDAACHVELGFACTVPACDAVHPTYSACTLDPCLLPLRVSEVMADGLNEHASEWIELVNAGVLTIPLGPWSVGDQANIQASGEGMVRFPDGATLAPGAVLVLAKDPAHFMEETGHEPDYGYGVDDLPPIALLARESDWAPGTAIELANDQDEVVLACAGALRDSVRWGPAADRLGAPAEYDATHPQNGPHAFTRLDLDSAPTALASWAVTRCPSPGEAPASNAPPDVGPAVVFVAPGQPTNLYLPGDDPDGEAITFALQTAGLVGTLTLTDAAHGIARYTPPAGVNAVDTGFTFTASDSCVTSSLVAVTIHVAGATCDPTQVGLRLTEVHADARVDNVGEWLELANPTASTIDLSYLRLGDEETRGGREGMFVFPAGTKLAPGAALVVAFSAAEFEAEWGFAPDLEWNRDTDGDAQDDLARDASWSSGTMRLDNDGDELMLVGCDGAVIDAIYWGKAQAGETPIQTPWSVRLAPLPSYPSPLGPGGPLTYARRSPTTDTDTAADWIVERCPNPGRALSGNAAPVAAAIARPVPTGGTASGTLSATDADGDALTWTFAPPADGVGVTGATLATDPATGAFSYTAPAGFTGVVVIDVTVSDGCAEARTTLQFCVGTVETPDNGADEDCDGQALCHVDDDHDGFGGAALVLHAGGCAGLGVAPLGGDCDDTLASVRPGAPELCDGHDNDCNPATADGAADPQLGAPCDSAADANLCNDDRWGCVVAVAGCIDNPAGDNLRIEVCDLGNADEDCDGGADDVDPDGSPASGASTFYRDDDHDRYGRNGTATQRCDAAPGWAPVAGDCDDDVARCGAGCNPGLGEATTFGNCTDGYDNDCDGESPDRDDACFAPLLCFEDKDSDGVGSSTTYVVLSGAAVAQGCAAYADGTHAKGYWVAAAGDCDDEPTHCGAACRPGLPDLCDGKDNDCSAASADGSADLAVGIPCDSPEDVNLCLDEATSCRNGGIVCDNVLPGDDSRVERCDPLNADEDCDGLADDADLQGAAGRTKFYRDRDGDGRGDSAQAIIACDAPQGYVASGGDCDDDPAQCGAHCRAGLVESRGEGNCHDTYDNDCDGHADQDPECFGLVLCYRDADDDGYGDFAVEREFSGDAADQGCSAYHDAEFPTAKWVSNGLDCDDLPTSCGAACHPNALELCDGKDNDCTAATADGAGDAGVGVPCDSPVDADGCLDDRSACQAGGVVCVNLAANDAAQVEVCDTQGGDEDCDGGANDADPQGAPQNASIWFIDADGDGLGSPSVTVRACGRPNGYIANSLDCDDDPNSCGARCRPGLLEVCDGRDNDCRPETQDGADDLGIGEPCDSPDDADRCLDEFTSCSDGAVRCVNDPHSDTTRVEVCDPNHADEDCDGLADDLDPDGTPENAQTWYGDRDHDGHGDPGITVKACVTPPGFVVSHDDCDDDPSRCGASCAPGHVESLDDGNCADGIDNDCDGETDIAPACLPPITCYADMDNDGFGDKAAEAVRASTAGPCPGWSDGHWVSNDDDCDDTAASAHPGAAEVPGNDVDEDCNGRISCWQDLDGDGFAGDAAQSVEAPVAGTCELSSGLASERGDCDDDRAACGGACHPGGSEVCDGFDNDCDGSIDEAVCETHVGAGYVDGGSGCGGGGGTGALGLLSAAIALMKVVARRKRARA